MHFLAKRALSSGTPVFKILVRALRVLDNPNDK